MLPALPSHSALLSSCSCDPTRSLVHVGTLARPADFERNASRQLCVPAPTKASGCVGLVVDHERAGHLVLILLLFLEALKIPSPNSPATWPECETA